jgi:hypothetical protein
VQAVSIAALFVSMFCLLRVLCIAPLLRVFAYVTVACFGTFTHIYSFFWTETLFTALSLGIGACALSILNRETTSNGYWATAFVLLFLASAVKFIGVFNLAWLLVPLWAAGRKRWPLGLAAIGSAAVPVVLWFLRNKVLYGFTIIVTPASAALRPARSMEFVRFFHNELFDARFVPAGLLVAFFVAAVAMPFLGALEPKRAGRKSHAALLLAAASFVLGMWVLTQFARFNRIDDRLLVTGIAIGIVGLYHGFNCIAARFASWRAHLVALALPLLFLTASNHTSFSHLLPRKASFPYPVEKQLWQRLADREELAEASHFYSDDVFTHQIFAGMPQRIIFGTGGFSWTHDLRDYLTREELWATGTNPFFLVSTGSSQYEALNYFSTRPDMRIAKIDFEDLGYAVFYRPE